MGIIGGALASRLLKRFRPDAGTDGTGAYESTSKLEVLLGPSVWDVFRNKVVVDFGCGLGNEAIEIAGRGAARVVGVDIRDTVLEQARRSAVAKGVSGICEFVTQFEGSADVVLSVDAFEHFADPQSVLDAMRGAVHGRGMALIAFGPTWYHPLGGHLFSVFPWAHLVFTEEALLRWRSDFRADGARRFSEVEGGLNQMTIRRFRELVAASRWTFESLECVPIRKLRYLASPVTREFTTAYVRCRLVPRGQDDPTNQ
jgi:SAM-dependent methyltransferase